MQMNALREAGKASLQAWPVTVLCFCLIIAFALPGLVADQTREALFDYVQPESRVSILWPRYALSLTIAGALAASMPCWVNLNADPSLGRGVFSGITASVPCLVLAIAFFELFHITDIIMYLVLAAGFSALLLLLFAIKRVRQRILSPTAVGTKLWSKTTACTLILAVGIFGLTGSASVEGAQILGPANILLLAIFTITASLSLLTALGRRTGTPMIAICVIAAFAFDYFDLNDNHPIRGKPSPLTANSFESMFADWRANRPNRDDYVEYPVVLVSTEGGGIRAAYFTAITLARLVDHCPRMANHIFVISGVSGGSVGATIFAAALKADPPDINSSRCSMSQPGDKRYERRIAAVFKDDHLSPILARLLFPDFLQRFLPFPVDSFDRQLGLERSLEMSFERQFQSPLLSGPVSGLEPTSRTPAVPYLILNTTWVESGERVTISPFIFLGEDFTYLSTFKELSGGFEPRASAAAASSARFPLVSPAGYVGNGMSKYRFVDGGYADNSGAQMTMQMLRSLISSSGGTYRKDNPLVSRYILFHIGNAPECEIMVFGEPQTAASTHCGQSRSTPYGGGSGEMLSPLRAVVAARSARAVLTLRQWEREITSLQDNGQPSFSHRVQMYDRGTPVPLGWLLSSRTTAELDDQLDARGANGRCESQTGIRNWCQLDGLIDDVAWFRRP